jgi:hypothetical protein
MAITFNGIDKVHKKVTAGNKEKGIDHFSLVGVERERTFYLNQWNGMKLVDNLYYPKSYVPKYNCDDTSVESIIEQHFEMLAEIARGK